MENSHSGDWFKSIQTRLERPGFFSELFSLLALREKRNALDQAIADPYAELSKRVEETQIQLATTVRNVLRTRKLAELLISDEGELQFDLLAQFETDLKKKAYTYGPDYHHDAVRTEHILKVMRWLQQDKELYRLLKSITKPYANRIADQIIRDSLLLPPTTTVTDAHARRAALSALFCYLRQNVGSCFATAPAMIIHDEQPRLFFQDLIDLLNTGRLKRTFGGIEYSAPISSTWGAGDLRKGFMLARNGEEHFGNPIWRSPGFLAALEAVELIAADQPLAQQKAQAKKLVQAFIHATTSTEPYLYTSVESLLKALILSKLGITEQDLHDYDNRPRLMLPSSLIAPVPVVVKTTATKSDLCARFYSLFENSCNAFKAFTDHALLRSWEFTVASFAETKADFTKWNLYSSLGFRPEEKGGIGAQLYELLQRKVEIQNAKVAEFQREYEQQYLQVKYLEGRLQRASTEDEIKWMRVEYQAKSNEFYTLQEIRDDAHEKARRYAELFDQLVDHYLVLFPDYFQEVYDADLHEAEVGPYDDSPAGFRLLFKHGRSHTALWKRIRNPAEFIESLSSFFVMSEAQMANDEAFKGVEQDLGEITTAIVGHIKTQEFLETAFYRMAAAQGGYIVKDPLNNLDKIQKKPWAYTSGGTMETLVSCYFRLEQPPAENSRWVESEVELLVYLLDTIKKMPTNLSQGYLKDATKGILIHSPTHAFLLKPGLSRFQEGVEDHTYTYIWVRDQVVQPMQRFVNDLFVDRAMMESFVRDIEKSIPPEFRHYYNTVFRDLPGQMKATEFRRYMMDQFEQYRGLQYQGSPLVREDQLDSLLYESLPYTHRFQLRKRLEQLFEGLPQMTEKRKNALLHLFDELSTPIGGPEVIGAKTLQEIAKSLLCLESGALQGPADLHLLIARRAQALGFALPTPLLFADSNWVTDFFGFVANPGSGQFELWRLDYTGSTGSPMSHWKQWLDGSRRDRTWGVYNRPSEYRW